ncbi:hypothetical protein DTO002I6_4816 [Penicillium roqueforti]|nr:hypothetical protein DTO002I6_4816 [Penicillium roqueforti]
MEDPDRKMGKSTKMTNKLAAKLAKWRKKEKPDRTRGGALVVSPTAESNTSEPSMVNYVQPSDGLTGNPDKLSKPALVTSNTMPVSSLFEPLSLETTDVQPENFIPGPSSSPTTEDTWARAYKLLQAREPELVKDYQTHLSLAQPENSEHINLSNPHSVERVIKQLLEVRDQKQWRVSLVGKEVKIREQAEKLVKFLLWAEPAVKKAVSTQPYAALAWAGVSLLLPLLTSSTTSNLAMLEGFDSIDHVQIYWDICEKTYLQSKDGEEYQALIQPLAKVYSFILEYQARAICHFSKAQVSRAWENMTGESNWGKIRLTIEQLSDNCRSYVSPLKLGEVRRHRDRQLLEIKESRVILDGILDVLKADTSRNQKNYKDQNERGFLQALASDYEDGKNYNPLRIPGTCDWFLQGDVLRNWRDNDRSSLLWISAGPGCGKSVLSRALIDENRLSTNISTSTVCYFFFKDGDERRVSATDALCALLHQLFTHDPTGTLIQNAMPSHKNHGPNLVQNFSELWRLFIQCVSSPEVGEIVCVLDALDECNDHSSRQLIRKLRELYSEPQVSSLTSKLKFLITGRPYDHLEASFQDFPDTTTCVRLDGDEKTAEISNDIDLVIDARLQNLAQNLLESDRQMISDQLNSMENRTYLWLHLTFDIIEHSRSEYGRLSDMKELFSGLPSKVSEAYEKILDRSGEKLQTENLLQIVLAASRPLSLDEANIALTMALRKGTFSSYDDLQKDLWPRNNFKGVVENLCGLFINVYDSKLFFIHQTARDFLINPPRSGKWKGRLSMQHSHANMALLCLSFLSFLDGQSSVEQIEAKFPLARYSAQHWMDHARPAETENEVQKSVMEFFLQENQAWGELFESIYYRRSYGRPHILATPLYYASSFGLQQTAQLLLAKGADVNAQIDNYGSALQAASDRGYIEIVELLLAHGAEINAQGGIYGNALEAASSGGHKEIMGLLLANGAGVNTQGSYGSALQAASVSGHTEIAELLLANGAETNTQGGFYGSVLQAASVNGHTEIAELLLANGADIRTQGGLYGGALQAASSNGHKEMVELLLANGAEIDVNAQGGLDGNALQAASANGHKEIVELLLAHGAEINTQGGFYGSALQAASACGHKEVVELLLAKGAEINAQGGLYGSSFQAASACGHKEVVELLLAKGAEINA